MVAQHRSRVGQVTFLDVVGTPALAFTGATLLQVVLTQFATASGDEACAAALDRVVAELCPWRLPSP